MHHVKPPLLAAALFFLLFTASDSWSQPGRKIHGNVTDSLTGNPVPFATVTLRDNLAGTVTNENGDFQLLIPDGVRDDILIITLLGYRMQQLTLSTLRDTVAVRLSPVALELREVQVRAQPPEYYIRMAMRAIPENYPSSPFETRSYYREIIRENGNFLRSHEGIFRTYFPNFRDSSKNQHQLMLFRKASDLKELAFMKKERMKEEEKNRRDQAKGKIKNKGKDKKNDGRGDSDSLSIGELFGGPDNLLQLAGLLRDEGNFLDTNAFRDYHYSFASFNSYNDNSIMVIDFRTKGKVDRVRQSGRIYIDIASNAIVKADYRGEFVIPALLRPVLLVLGIGVKNPKFKSDVSFSQAKGRWYPATMLFNLNLEVERKRLFAANDNSSFIIDGVLTVNQVKITDAGPVPHDKRYKSSKRPEEQVHNDEGLSWEKVNIIR